MFRLQQPRMPYLQITRATAAKVQCVRMVFAARFSAAAGNKESAALTTTIAAMVDALTMSVRQP